MLLVIDVGNSNISLGLYQGATLIGNYRLTTWFKRTGDEYGFMIMSFLSNEGIIADQIEDVIISSVVPKIMHSFNNSIRKYLKREPIIVGPGIKTGISIKTDNPRELGADRLVAAAGAHFTYGGNVLVIDFGTATTFDFVNENAEFLGGTITPGLEVAAQALADSAAKLPEIEIKKVTKVCGTNTIASMQAGIFYGYIGLSEHIIEVFKRDIPEGTKVIATGGLGRLIAENSSAIDIYDPELVYKGLRIIYHRNQKLA